MAPAKRKFGEGSSRQKKQASSTSDARFVSAQAKKRYEFDAQRKRGFVAERGINFGDTEAAHVTDVIAKHGWKNFCQVPQAGVETIVMEFYANLPESSDGRNMVRGKVVKFDKETINEFYGLPEVDEQIFSNFKQQLSPADLIARLARPGATWSMAKGLHKNFPASYLSPEARLWQYFLSTRLVPTSHLSHIDLHRAYLLLAILNGIPLNVGKLINAAIVFMVDQPSLNYPFPNLITALILQSGVEVGADEILILPGQQMTYMYLRKLNRGNSSTDIPAEGTSQLGSSSVDIQQLTQRVDRLQIHQESFHAWAGPQIQYQTDMNSAMYQMMTVMYGQMGLDLSTISPLPERPLPHMFQPPSCEDKNEANEEEEDDDAGHNSNDDN